MKFNNTDKVMLDGWKERKKKSHFCDFFSGFFREPAANKRLSTGDVRHYRYGVCRNPGGVFQCSKTRVASLSIEAMFVNERLRTLLENHFGGQATLYDSGRRQKKTAFATATAKTDFLSLIGYQKTPTCRSKEIFRATLSRKNLFAALIWRIAAT